MKIKLLKKLVCLFGMLLLTFPAWSAVPSNLLPDDGSCNQAPAVADVENPLFEGDMLLAGSGGGKGGSRNRGRGGKGTGGYSSSRTHSKNQEQNQEQVQTRSQQQNKVQTQSQTQTQTQTKTQSQSQVQAMPKKPTQDGGSGTTK